MTATNTAPTVVKISAQAELQYSKREALEVRDRERHILALGEVRGINQNTSASDFFADASAVNVETADLMQGNGSIMATTPCVMVATRLQRSGRGL